MCEQTWASPQLHRRLPLSKPSCQESRRHPNTWLALIPCARATRATDAPSTNVSSTIRRFSAMLRCCRVGAPNDSLLAVITSRTCREVSISAPSGHHSVSVHFTRMALNYGDVQTVTTGRLHKSCNLFCNFGCRNCLTKRQSPPTSEGNNLLASHPG